MNKLLILGLIIILIISLIYKVYTRKKLEGLTQLRKQEIPDYIEKGFISKEVGDYIKRNSDKKKHNDLNELQKYENATKDEEMAKEEGGTTTQYRSRYPNGRMNRQKARVIYDWVSKNQQPELTQEENINQENINEYTKDLINVQCNTCDDVSEAYGHIGCALYYEPGKKDDSKLTLYYKNTAEAVNMKISDDYNKVEKVTNKGHLIKKSSKCKEIKSLEKCKKVNSCSSLLGGSAEDRRNCVVCEDPISNGIYQIEETYPIEHKFKNIVGDLRVQRGFPMDWKEKGYKCRKDYGPFGLDGCQRGACADDYDPPGPNTAECYSELYNKNGGVGPPIDKEWWNNNETTNQTIKFNGELKSSDNNEFTWENPTGTFQEVVANISSKTNIENIDYDSAKKAYIFKNGPVDKNKIQDFACTHQEKTSKPNIDCQLKKERDAGLKPSAIGSYHKQKYVLENFSNLKEGYSCTNTVSPDNSVKSVKIGYYFDKFIKELRDKFSTLKYGNELEKKEYIKTHGRGDKKQAALQVFGKSGNFTKPKKGDHVKFSLNNQIVKGVVVEIENKVINGSTKTMALCIWDYYKGSNKIEYYRQGYSVCNEKNFISNYGETQFNNSDCIDGVTSQFDIGKTNCPPNNLSCELVNKTSYTRNKFGSYKNMMGSFMGKMLDGSIYTDTEKKLWREEGWIDIDELERLHICEKKNCKKGYFSCDNTVNNYINL